MGLPVEYRANRIQGVLDHEIGTHFIRKYNDKMQIWYGNRRKYEMKPFIVTEEGLATLNMLVNTVYIYIPYYPIYI